MRVWVWDSNPFNVYGAEIARVIADSGSLVRRYCRRGSSIFIPNVRSRRVLPRPSGGKPTRVGKMLHVLAMLEFGLLSLLTRPVVVLPWTEAHDRWYFQLLANLGVRVVLVVHNPVDGRDEAIGDVRVTALRESVSAVVVHSQRLASGLATSTPVYVVGHPAYFAWVSTLSRRVTGPVLDDNPPTALYLGAVRHDKGFRHLPAIAERLALDGVRLNICVGMLSGQHRAAVQHLPNVTLPPPDTGYVSDEDLYRAIKRAAVMIAPYENVTASGSVIMALSAGLRAVAFDSEGMKDILPDECLTSAGDPVGLATRAAQLALEPSVGAGSVAQDLDDASRFGWERVVFDVAEKNLSSSARRD